MRIPIRSFICLAGLLLLAALARPAGAQTGAGVVRGTVVDSLTSRALAGAIVQIARESNPAPLRTDTTDAAGRFQFNEVPPGRYVIGFSHPALDSLGIDIADRTLTLSDGASPEVLLAIPSGRTLVTSLCGASVDTDSTGLFIGRVMHTGDMPIRDGGLRASWNELRLTEQGLRLIPAQRQTDAGPGGWFAVCGLPLGTAIETRGWIGTDSTGLLQLQLPANGLLRRDLFVSVFPGTGEAAAGTPDPAPGAITGTTRSLSGAPLVGTQVVIVGTSTSTVTDAEGRFVIGSAPAGTHTLMARRLGFAPFQAVVDILPTASSHHDITMAPIVTTLDTMSVRAAQSASWRSDLESRRASGFGRYIVESDIERRNPMQVTDLLRDVPGVEIVPLGLTKVPVMKREGGQEICFPTVYVDGFRQPRPQGDTLALMLDLELLVGVANVRAIEVYSRWSRVPVQFLDPAEQCGSLVIWSSAAR